MGQIVTHTMSKDNVVELKKPDVFVNDPITELVRNGAREILAKALEAEISVFIHQYKELVDDLGRQRVVRNGYLPERDIQTGIGPVKVKAPRVRDRSGHRKNKINFNSNMQAISHHLSVAMDPSPYPRDGRLSESCRQ